MKYTKGLLLSVMLLSVVLLASCTEEQPALHLSSGEKIKLTELHGKVVLINYWATWCKPCREEIPELNEFAAENPERAAVFAVNFDGETGEQHKQQAASIGIEFPLLEVDPRQLFAIEPSGVLPETLVIDQRGNIQQVLLGPQTKHKLEMLLSSLEEELPYDG